MKKILTLALASLAIMSCNNSNKGADSSTESNSDSLAAAPQQVVAAPDTVAEVKYPELTEERCKELLKAVPEHGDLYKPKTTLSARYYSTWCEAWEIPDGGMGGIGNNEFLYYFICGNDPCPSHSAKIINIAVDGDKAVVKFHIKHSYGYTDRKLHTFKLVVENDRWVIDDYDDTMNEMKEYIVEQRKYLRSDELMEQANEILNDPETDEEWKERIRNEVKTIKAYLRKH